MGVWGKETGGFGNRIKSIFGEKSTEQGWISELARGEQEAWKNKVLGTEVEVRPLPDYVTPEVKTNLEKLGFGEIIYMPKLDLETVDYLNKVGVDHYLKKLHRKYPKWKPLESLTRYSGSRQQSNHTVSRNLEKWYWEIVKNGNVVFPVLPGQWLAVETVDKPSYGEKYRRTPFAERLGFRDDRFNVSWNEAHNAIEIEKLRILSDLEVAGRPVDIRMLEALEWNLLGNREGWGKTNTYEWTNTEYRGSGESSRLIVGNSGLGGAGFTHNDHPDNSSGYIGFRAAVVLGS